MLSGEQFFHGTVHEFQAGDEVRPAGSARYHLMGSGEHAYATTRIGNAVNYAELAHNHAVSRMERGPFPVPRVYLVEPVGEHEEDPNGLGGSDFRARSWRVLREHDVSEHLGDPEDWRH